MPTAVSNYFSFKWKTNLYVREFAELFVVVIQDEFEHEFLIHMNILFQIIFHSTSAKMNLFQLKLVATPRRCWRLFWVIGRVVLSLLVFQKIRLPPSLAGLGKTSKTWLSTYAQLSSQLYLIVRCKRWRSRISNYKAKSHQIFQDYKRNREFG